MQLLLLTLLKEKSLNTPLCAFLTILTDASDYGVGGYLFQVVDGIDHPVAFVSKSLSKTELRWSVIQKEAYAIFSDLIKSKACSASGVQTIFLVLL